LTAFQGLWSSAHAAVVFAAPISHRFGFTWLSGRSSKSTAGMFHSQSNKFDKLGFKNSHARLPDEQSNALRQFGRWCEKMSYRSGNSVGRIKERVLR
jgi:hypothetical protein